MDKKQKNYTITEMRNSNVIACYDFNENIILIKMIKTYEC